MATRYLLDTNICIYIARHRPPEVRERFACHGAGELAMSIVTYGELRFGAEKSTAKAQATLSLQALTGLVEVVPLGLPVGDHYGEIRADLQRRGLPIGNNDLWIAAHARAEDWVLVTNNEREFERVPGLRVETGSTAQEWIDAPAIRALDGVRCRA